jgi:hypothetical protein
VHEVRHVFELVMSAWGCVVIYGTHKRWRFFIDPPDNNLLCRLYFYNIHRLKRDHGTKAVVILMYLIGVVFVVMGIVGQFLP